LRGGGDEALNQLNRGTISDSELGERAHYIGGVKILYTACLIVVNWGVVEVRDYVSFRCLICIQSTFGTITTSYFICNAGITNVDLYTDVDKKSAKAPTL
jgi:hypothetical protein